MAKKCKHRSTFKMTKKCETCANRRKCRRIIRKNRKRRGRAVAVAIIILVAVMGGILFTTMFQKEDEPVIMKAEVDLIEVRGASQVETEVKKVTQEEKQTTEQIIQPLDEEDEEDEEKEEAVTFTESEKIAMGKTVYKEARGECEDGRIAIVAVILNRLETGSEEYGAENGNVMEVITYPGAFAYPKDMTDETFINCPEYEMCMAAVEAAISGVDPTRIHFPQGARHFYSLVEELSEKAKANREGVDTYIIGNQAFHNDMNN